MDIHHMYTEFVAINGLDETWVHLEKFGNYIKNCIVKNNILCNHFEDAGVEDLDSYFIVAISTSVIQYNRRDNYNLFTSTILHDHFILTSHQLNYDEMMELSDVLQIYEDELECIPFCRIVQIS